MPFSAWRKWWRRSSPRSKKLSKKPHFRKCFLEILEDRTLLSNTYTVNLVTDSVINTGQQTGPNSGDLRWCIEQADLNPGSTIQFDPTVFPSSANTPINLSQGELQISESMNIQGPGASTVTVSGTDGKGGGSRVFDITNSSSVVTIAGLTIANGNANVTYTPVAGNQGGDIFNGGNLTLQNDIVTNGFSIGNIGGPVGRGGAIYNAEGQGNTVLTLDNTIVENSTAEGVKGGDVNGSWWPSPPLSGNGGPALGGGIYNDVSALLIVKDGSQIINNIALGGSGGNGGKGANGPFTGAPGGNGGNGGSGGLAQGGGIYNNSGSLELNGNTLSSIVIADNVAQGGKGGLGGNGGNGKDGPAGGKGGASGSGGSGGVANGGGVYNTGSVSFPSKFTLQYVNFLGDQAVGGTGNNAGNAGNAGNGTKAMGGTGGEAGSGGTGGNSQGGAIYTAWGTLAVPNVLFGLDANGVGNQALGGNGGNGGAAGNGGNSAGESASKTGNPGAPGGDGGIGGDAGFADGGAVANIIGGGNVAFTNTIFNSTLAKGGSSGNGGNGGNGGAGAQANEGATKSPYSAGLGGLGGPGGAAGAGGNAAGGGVFNSVGSLTIANSFFLGNRALGGSGGNAGAGGNGGVGGARTSKSFLASTTRVGGLGGSGGAGGGGGSAQGGGFYNLVGSVSVVDTSFQWKAVGGIGNEAVSGSGGNAGNGGIGGQGGDNGSSKGNIVAGGGARGGNAGAAGTSGLAEGGAGGNQGGDTFLSGDIFTSSLVKVGNGGDGGNGGTGGGGGKSNASAGADGVGGNGGDASNGGASAKGLGGAMVVSASNLTLSNSTFGGPTAALGNQVIGGAGGAGGIGGGWGFWGHTGARYEWATGVLPLAGNGGHGGLGAYVYGGALSVGSNAQTVQITGTTFTNSSITSGAGGNGGQAGLFSFDGANKGFNGIGGDGGLAQGGAVSLSAKAAQSATLNNVTISSSTATASDGGAGAINDLATAAFLIGGSNGFGSAGGNGGSVHGVGLANVNYNLSITNGSFNGGVGKAGMGGSGGSASVNEPFSWAGGAGGAGGAALGGGVFFSNQTSSKLNFTFAGGSTSNDKLSGGVGGNGGFAGASGHSNVTGGAGGNGGNVQGGGIYILAGSNAVNTTALNGLDLLNNVLGGGTGGVGGAGFNAPGGNGGVAAGGGLYNSSNDSTTPSSLSLSGSTLAGNLVTGGIGGNAGSGTTPNGGAGGAGGAGGFAEGGGMFNGQNTPLSVVNSTFGGGSTNSSTPNANANILTGGRGGRGGDAGTPTGVPRNDGGLGGDGGIVSGGDVYIASNASTFINDTLVYGIATAPGLGGVGGSGAGLGGLNGPAGTPGTGNAGGYFAAGGTTNTVGNTIIDLNSASNSGVQLLNSFSGLDFNSSNNNTPPNPQLAVGSTSYVETVSQTVAVYSKTTGATLAIDSLTDFWTNQGNILRADAGSTFANPTVIWDEQIQRFIIAEQDVDTSTHVSTVNIAVSKSASLLGLTGANWNFFQVTTTENTGNGFTANFDAKNLGTLGWNHDALVFTLNMVNQTGGIDHVQVNAISINALVNGTALTQGANAFQTDLAGANLRPTVMHDSKAGDPMWLVEEGGDNQSIKVVQMTNILAVKPTFGTTNVAVNPYSQAVPPKQPNGKNITTSIDSSIQNVAEQNGLLVAAQTVSNSTGNQDEVQWYILDVSSGTPRMQQQGDVSGGAGVYDVFPSININSKSAIGMTFIQSGTGAGQYMSMYVTGRLTTDPVSTMGVPLLVQAGQANYSDFAGGREGALSGISVDSDGSFWAANEFANKEASANWGTGIAQFNLANFTNDVVGSFTSLGTNILGTTIGSTGFGPNDNIGVTATQLNLGPLLNNGGATLTDALLNNTTDKSVAIDAGGNALVTATTNPWYNLFGPSPSDQRGPGFPRLDLANHIVDVGAYELNAPIINSLNPPSQDEQSPSFTLTITGTGFVPGALVSFAGTTLTPLTVNSTQITVTIPAALLPDEGTASVVVSIPDGSGVAAETLNSNTATFTITEAATLTLTNPGNQDNNEGDKVDPVTISSSDPDTTFGATGLPPGLSIDQNTGIITGTINPYAVINGGPSQDFTVTINGIDDGVVRGSVTFTWTVEDTTPPTLTAPPTQNNNEGDNVTPITIAAVDADPGTFTDVVNGQHTLPTGLSIDPNTGEISGTIGARAEGTYTVTISASDNGNASSIQFTWKVADTTPPTLTSPGNQNSNEGANITALTIQAVDADSFNITGLPTGLTYDTTSGIISGTIGSYAAGTYTVTVTALDNGYQSQPISFTWTVNDTTPPGITNPGTVNNNESDKVSLQIQSQDADPGTFTDLVNGQHTLPTGLSIDPNTGLISGTIGARAAGNYTVTISANDGTNVGSTTFTWSVADTTPPTLTSPGNQTNNEGDNVKALAIPAVDADIFSITGLPTGLTYSTTTGVISGTIGAYAAGTYTVNVTATDNGFLSQPISFTWTVNDTTAPAITNPGNQTNNEGETITPLAIQATDGETYSATGLPTGLSINATTGVISGSIDSRAANTYNVTVTAFDGTNPSSTSFTWTVDDTTPPLLSSPGTQNDNEGDKVSLQIQSQDADSGTFTDVANGLHTLPTGLSIDPNTGIISGTIDPRAAGTYTVTISASDGTLPDGTSNVGSTTFTWNVADSTAPTLTNPGDQSNNEGDNITGLAIQAVDADSFSATGLPTGLSIDSKTGVISGTIDTQAGDNSPYTVTVYAYDSGNASSISFTWTVADSAPPSFTNPGGQISNEGDTVSLATNPVGADPGTIMAIGLPTGLSIDPNTGVISGTIDPHGAGAYAVSISASDNGHSGGIAFTWRVNDTTPPTVINPGGQHSLDGAPVNLAIHALDADPGTFTATGLPAGLSINANTGVISGTVLAPAGTYHVTVNAGDGSVVSSVTFPWVVSPQTTSAVITNVHNSYVGLFQLETVTAQVTDPSGIPINGGVLTFQVNGKTVVAPVVNGFATATIVTSLFDMNLTVLLNDLFTHSLDAVFSDPSGVFGSAGASVSEPGMLFDYLLFLESVSFGSLAQQLSQLQSSS